MKNEEEQEGIIEFMTWAGRSELTNIPLETEMAIFIDNLQILQDSH